MELFNMKQFIYFIIGTTFSLNCSQEAQAQLHDKALTPVIPVVQAAQNGTAQRDYNRSPVVIPRRTVTQDTHILKPVTLIPGVRGIIAGYLDSWDVVERNHGTLNTEFIKNYVHDQSPAESPNQQYRAIIKKDTVKIMHNSPKPSPASLYRRIANIKKPAMTGFSQNGQYLVIAYTDGTLALHDPNNNFHQKYWLKDQESSHISLKSFGWSADGTKLVTLDQNNLICVWENRAHNLIHTEKNSTMCTIL
jgi:WD40 repeat protein